MTAHVVVVGREAVGETEGFGENAGADEGRGGEAGGMRDGRKGGMRLVQDEAFHVAQAVAGGVRAGQDGGMRGQGERDLRHGPGEAQTAGRKGIEMRSFRFVRGGITTEVVGAGGVERDQEDVGVARRG